MAKIYWASSLHSETMRRMNEDYAAKLETAGHRVLLPQRHGIWEDMMRKEMLKGVSAEEALENVKGICYSKDMEDMIECDTIVAYCPKIPSEGTCYELGFCIARGKTGILLVPNDEVFKEINLMVTRSCPRAQTIEEVVDFIADIESWYAAQDFRREEA